MTIVPIGKLIIQAGEGKNREEYLPGFISGLQEAVKEVVKRSIEAELGEEVTRVLKRKPHGRSKKVGSEEKGADSHLSHNPGNRKTHTYVSKLDFTKS
jgi:hypothetical protein